MAEQMSPVIERDVIRFIEETRPCDNCENLIRVADYIFFAEGVDGAFCSEQCAEEYLFYLGKIPFCDEPLLKRIRLRGAEASVREALTELRAAAKHAGSWGEYETLVHFISQLEEFLECDHGEAGFSPYIERVTRRLR